MLTRRLLPLFVPAWIITLAIAASVQAQPATAFSRASDSNLLSNKSAIDMVAPKLAQEVVIGKIQTSKTNFELSTPLLIERTTAGCLQTPSRK